MRQQKNYLSIVLINCQINVLLTKNPAKINHFTGFFQKGDLLFICGAGGNRTLVQTSSQKAFYMLSPELIFGILPGQGRPKISLASLIFVSASEPYTAYPGFCGVSSGHGQV